VKVYNLRMLVEVLNSEEEEVLDLLREGKLAGNKLAGEWFVSERQVREYLNSENREEKSGVFW